MRVIQFDDYGPPSVLHLAEVDTPTAGHGQLSRPEPESWPLSECCWLCVCCGTLRECRTALARMHLPRAARVLYWSHSLMRKDPSERLPEPEAPRRP